MSNNSTAVSNVIPFKFGKQQVRTLAINNQPWFVAADVCASLSISNVSLAVNGRADRENDGLDEDEKGVASVNTPSGAQSMLIVNESGLYGLIFKSRKAEAKVFRKWVTAEVLPSIRETGKYEAPAGKMEALISQLTLTPAHQRHILNRVAELAGMDRKKYPTVWRSIKDHFQVGSYKDIPDSQYPAVCKFMLCKPMDSEIPEAKIIQAESGIYLSQSEAHHLHLLMTSFSSMFQHKEGMLIAARALGSSPLMAFVDHLIGGHGPFRILNKRHEEIHRAYTSMGCAPSAAA